MLKITTLKTTLLAMMIMAFAGASFAMSRSLDQLTIKTRSGQEIAYNIELATTPQEITTGLMYREFLPADQGMLFIFSDSNIRNFWMKNTLIPLDMLFIDRSGIIKHIHHNAIPQDLTQISSIVPVKTVLEINGGQVQEKGINVGDRVIHKLFLAPN